MKELSISHTSKMSAKGWIVVSRELPDRHGIKPSMRVEQVETEEGILMRPIRLLEDWRALAARIGKNARDAVNAAALRSAPASCLVCKPSNLSTEVILDGAFASYSDSCHQGLSPFV